MKKLILLILLALVPAAMPAQRIFNFVLGNANKVINNPTSSFVSTQVEQFKKTALVYLRSKARETKQANAEALLDNQAYYLSQFISLYIDTLVKSKNQSREKQVQKVEQFINASKLNKLFNDTDHETADAYLLADKSLTPFSLDTDWQKAYEMMK